VPGRFDNLPVEQGSCSRGAPEGFDTLTEQTRFRCQTLPEDLYLRTPVEAANRPLRWSAPPHNRRFNGCAAQLKFQILWIVIEDAHLPRVEGTRGLQLADKLKRSG
jgi:hypothetical protein